MVAVSDNDASTSVDSEVQRTPFPFWLGVVTITGRAINDLDGTPLSGTIILTPSAPVYIPGWSVLEGSASMNVVNGVASPITIPCTDSVSPGFTYTIIQRLNTPDGGSGNPAPITGVTVPRSLMPTVDISQLL